MALSIGSELQKAFHLVALRRDADVLLTGRQWEKRKALIGRCERARQKEESLFEERFDARIAVEQKRLLNQAGSRNRTLQPDYAQNDLFDKTALLTQADTNVRNAHENRLDKIQDFETEKLESLLLTSARENQLQGKAKRSFNNKADRRQSPRHGKSSRTQSR